MDANAIFDAFAKASTAMHIAYRIKELEAKIRDLQSNDCGNCFYWMKATYVPERKDKVIRSWNDGRSCRYYMRDRYKGTQEFINSLYVEKYYLHFKAVREK